MTTLPHRDWSGRELAERLQITPRNLHTQLGEWAKLGFITRTGFATYALNTPPGGTPSTTAPHPYLRGIAPLRDRLTPTLDTTAAHKGLAAVRKMGSRGCPGRS
jgi:hypothetical protein